VSIWTIVGCGRLPAFGSKWLGNRLCLLRSVSDTSSQWYCRIFFTGYFRCYFLLFVWLGSCDRIDKFGSRMVVMKLYWLSGLN
jgi:hypothetical protein